MGEANKLYDMIQQEIALQHSINSAETMDKSIEEFEEEIL